MHLVSFSRLEDLISDDQLALVRPNRTQSFNLSRYLRKGIKELSVKPADARRAVVRLFRMAWERKMKETDLKTYALSGRALCFWFPDGFAERNKVYFTGPGADSRILCGRTKGKYWHLGISGKVLLEPVPCLALRAHILFSDDGSELWSSHKRMHKKRRRVFKTWWNDRWRDFLLAAVTWISRDSEYFELPLGVNVSGAPVSLRVMTSPVLFTSPVTYAKPQRFRTETEAAAASQS